MTATLGVPRLTELASDPLTHRFGDLFNPPGLTNFLGVVQVDHDLTGFCNLNFPPLALGNVRTAALFLDGEYFIGSGVPITYTWFPDKVVREANWRGIRLRSELRLAMRRQAALLKLELTLEGGEARDVDVAFLLRSGTTQRRTGWEFSAPTEDDNESRFDATAGAVVFRSRHTDAACAQGFGEPGASYDRRLLSRTVQLEPGRPATLRFVSVLDTDQVKAMRALREATSSFDGLCAEVEAEWEAELEAVFTPGNDRYSGSLPLLQTSDDAVRRVYNNAVIGLVYFRRDNPASVHGRAWDTLMPRYWGTVTFLWDYHLSSLAHALLDPVTMRGYLERWMQLDVHRHFGSEWLNGGGVGAWYSVNDYAMVAMARDYLEWTGDAAWLDATPDGGPRVADRLVEYATWWQKFQTTSGLADYGVLVNLLECVGTYVHEVASLNAGNVYAMRKVAELLPPGDPRAAELRAAADELLPDVLKLYAEGEGYWHARFPDGSLVPVRHCYDFFTTLETIGADLGERRRAEMADFFIRELQSPLWMRALSTRDIDAAFHIRPDHQWTGAYPAWPPRSVQGLYRAGRGQEALDWLRRMARSANQGPFSQAHFVETAVEPDAGGARKAPSDEPFITDWNVSSSGSWLNAVIESVFGVKVSLRDGITAAPEFHDFDPGAELRNLRHQGRLYRVTRAGVEVEPGT